MNIIDAHAHIYERLSGFGPRGEARAIGNGMVEWATGEKEPFLRPEHGDFGFSPEKLIELMDEGGVEHAVILQGSNYGFQNSFIAESAAKYPSRLTGVGSFDPYCAKAYDIFENLTVNLGFKSLKFEISEKYGLMGYHPDLKIDGEIFEPFFALAEEKGIAVTIDTGTISTKSCQPYGLENVIKRHKNLTLVIAHTFFPSGTDGKNDIRLGFVKLLKGENVFFDIANLQSSSEPFPYESKREYIRKAADIVGADHIIWGTDCPGVFMGHTYKSLAEYICTGNLFSADELDKIMYKNAKYVYKIK